MEHGWNTDSNPCFVRVSSVAPVFVGSNETQENGGAAADFVADFNLHFHRFTSRDEHFGSRAELDHAVAIAGANFFFRLEPADNASSHGPGNLLDADQSPQLRFLHVHPQLLIASRAVGVPGIEKSPGEIANVKHSAAARHAVDMHVENGKKDADSES